jgi:hypothetical protein
VQITEPTIFPTELRFGDVTFAVPQPVQQSWDTENWTITFANGLVFKSKISNVENAEMFIFDMMQTVTAPLWDLVWDYLVAQFDSKDMLYAFDHYSNLYLQMYLNTGELTDLVTLNDLFDSDGKIRVAGCSKIQYGTLSKKTVEQQMVELFEKPRSLEITSINLFFKFLLILFVTHLNVENLFK